MNNRPRLTGIIILIVGVILLLWPGSTLTALCSLLGWCLIIGGILEIVIGFVGDRYYANMGGGVFSVIIGLVFILRPDFIISFLPFVVGLATALGGVGFLARTLYLKEEGPFAVMTILGAAVAVVAGLILMINAYTAVKLLMIILGVFLIYFGILRILNS